MPEFTNEQILAANNNTQSEMINELSATIGQLHTQIAHNKSVIKSLSTYVQKLEQEKEAIQMDIVRLSPKPSKDPVEQKTSEPEIDKSNQAQ